MLYAVPSLTPRIDAINKKLNRLYASSKEHAAISQLVHEIEKGIDEYETMVNA